MKTDTTDYTELTDEQLSKLNGQRLKGLKKKMNKIIGKINYQVGELGNEDMSDDLKRAKSYHSRIIKNLEHFGNID